MCVQQAPTSMILNWILIRDERDPDLDTALYCYNQLHDDVSPMQHCSCIHRKHTHAHHGTQQTADSMQKLQSIVPSKHRRQFMMKHHQSSQRIYNISRSLFIRSLYKCLKYLAAHHKQRNNNNKKTSPNLACSVACSLDDELCLIIIRTRRAHRARLQSFFRRGFIITAVIGCSTLLNKIAPCCCHPNYIIVHIMI